MKRRAVPPAATIAAGTELRQPFYGFGIRRDVQNGVSVGVLLRHTRSVTKQHQNRVGILGLHRMKKRACHIVSSEIDPLALIMVNNHIQAGMQAQMSSEIDRRAMRTEPSRDGCPLVKEDSYRVSVRILHGHVQRRLLLIVEGIHINSPELSQTFDGAPFTMSCRQMQRSISGLIACVWVGSGF